MKRLMLVAFVMAMAGGPPATAQDAGWVSLFDGKTMAGWQAAERPESWVIEDGSLVSKGERSHLFYVGAVANHEFKNFELSAEVMTSPGANSGIYVHTKLQGPGWPEAGYELQVINSNPPATTPTTYIEHKMTGSIYAIRNTWKAPAKDNEWFRYRIRVVGKTIQTFVNDALICEYTEPASPFRPADKRGRLLGSGTFALQAHDPGSVVRYRALKVRLLPDDSPTPGTPLTDPELDELITQASNDNVPLIDLGLVPAGGAGGEALAGEARHYGVTPGGAFPLEAIRGYKRSLLIVNDREQAPDPAVLQYAKTAGVRIAFSSGGDGRIDEARLKRRLQAIKASGLVWRDFWVPGKD
jgi:Domain of Unknown Function (DUF1080)